MSPFYRPVWGCFTYPGGWNYIKTCLATRGGEVDTQILDYLLWENSDFWLFSLDKIVLRTRSTPFETGPSLWASISGSSGEHRSLFLEKLSMSSNSTALRKWLMSCVPFMIAVVIMTKKSVLPTSGSRPLLCIRIIWGSFCRSRDARVCTREILT